MRRWKFVYSFGKKGTTRPQPRALEKLIRPCLMWMTKWGVVQYDHQINFIKRSTHFFGQAVKHLSA